MNAHAFPVYTDRERAADRRVHIVGLGVAIPAAIGLIAVVSLFEGAGRAVPVAVYGAGLLAMLGCSAWYNLERRPAWREWARRFDHAAIYAMIAGTYTPFAVQVLPPASAVLYLGLIWAVAVTGVALKFLAARRFERASIAIYLLLGWAILPYAGPFLRELETSTLVLLAAGGVVYTAGVAVHLSRMAYQNAIWHMLVLVAAGCHFAAVAEIALAVR